MNDYKSKYSDEDVVRIVNPRQAYFYLQNGLEPLWVSAGYDDKIVYVFEKKPSLLLFKKWCGNNGNKKKEK